MVDNNKVIEGFYNINYNPGGDDFISVQQRTMKSLYEKARNSCDMQPHAEFFMIAYSLMLFGTYDKRLKNPAHIDYLNWIVNNDIKYQYIYDFHLGKYANSDLALQNYNFYHPRLVSNDSDSLELRDECFVATRTFFSKLNYPKIDGRYISFNNTEHLLFESEFPKEIQSLNNSQLLLLSQSRYPIFPYTLFRSRSGLFTLRDNLCKIAADREFPIAIYLTLESLNYLNSDPFGCHLDISKYYDHFYELALANGIEEVIMLN